ncbi:MAG: hypothetical protein ACJ8KU_02590, partial [Chthoniobacterales bacterium]
IVGRASRAPVAALETYSPPAASAPIAISHECGVIIRGSGSTYITLMMFGHSHLTNHSSQPLHRAGNFHMMTSTSKSAAHLAPISGG